MRPSEVHVSGLQNPAPSSSTLDTLSFQTIDPVLQSFPPGACLHGNHSRRPRINDSPNVATLIDGVKNGQPCALKSFPVLPSARIELTPET